MLRPVGRVVGAMVASWLACTLVSLAIDGCLDFFSGNRMSVLDTTMIAVLSLVLALVYSALHSMFLGGLKWTWSGLVCGAAFGFIYAGSISLPGVTFIGHLIVFVAVVLVGAVQGLTIAGVYRKVCNR